jgi:hypothetical protein
MFDFRRLICLYPEQIQGNSQAQARAFGEGSVPANGVGVFITPQSFVTFPVASSAVTTTYKLIKHFFPALSGNDIVVLLIALVIGAILYLYSINEGMKGREKWIAFFVAIFNSFLLAASALGLDKITN